MSSCNALCKDGSSISDSVEEILSLTPLIDGHDDLPIAIRFFYQNKIYNENFTFDTELMGHVDLPRLRKGRVGGTFWSIYVDCPGTDNNFTDAVYYKDVHDALQQIDLVHRLVAAYPDDLELALTPSAAVKAHADHKVASMMGVEGLHMIGNSASTLRLYHALGVRYVTLNHNCNNKYSDSALPADAPFWNGLSKDGEAIIKEMNRLGMMVDLAHTSKDTMVDTLSVTRAPVIFSHSSAFAICHSPRNVPDDVLHLVKDNGGVVMVNFYPEFVHCGPGINPEDATIDDVADHILHIAELIGWEYVGIGSDFDGIPIVPKGLEDTSKFPALFEILMSRGMTVEQGRMLAGENVLRVWRDVEKVARKMFEEGVQPLEDTVKQLQFEM
ncbi:uncharacterized protein LAJ45_06957 [Morchella importuna]|uniref:uncharacterized protein n=1 Tax=Morchella importuna TaxID=1174673 RepID=UPI001E8E6266|nr:uncharacterized protein LAJ45_06957 [Morchella importuna]KAH8148982.1 hypothetical protein LAJ45_06957 [Morchella importuna]